jgi:hypothetical protein
MLHRSMMRNALLGLAAGIALASALPAGAETPLGIRADGLRYQAEAYAYGWRPQRISRGESAAGIRADGLRYQAEAYAYGWRPQRISRGESAAGIRADGLRYQEEARVYLRRAGAGGGDGILVLGLIVSGAVVAAAGALLLLRAKSKMTGPSLATSAGGES